MVSARDLSEDCAEVLVTKVSFDETSSVKGNLSVAATVYVTCCDAFTLHYYTVIELFKES